MALTWVDEPADSVVRLRNAFVNVYLVGKPGAWMLVDAGLRSAAKPILDLARERFGSGTIPRAIVLTHGHFDHVGAVRELLRHWSVPVLAHAAELPYLTGRADYPPADPMVGGGMMALLSFLYPRRGIDLSPAAAALPEDGSLPLEGWRWIATPGHSPGHVSLFREADRCLIAGDAFVTTAQQELRAVLRQRCEIHGPPAYFTPDWAAARASVRALRDLRPRVALTGHGPPMQGDPLESGLEMLATRFDELAVPRRGRYVATAREPDPTPASPAPAASPERSTIEGV